MLISFLNLSMITFVILGYSTVAKMFIFKKNSRVENYDFIYGIVFITSILLLANFFIEINRIYIFIFLFGLIAFFFGFYKNIINIHFKTFFIILFLFCFITHNNSLNYDSPFYHLQIIKWINEYKIPFGLVNLEQRYAMPSAWHIFLSAFSYDFFKFNPIYLLSLIPFSFLLNQSISEKNFFSVSNLFLVFYNLFLLIFSLIHPFQDGIIFNHLGSPESDIIGIVFFGFSIYFFLKVLENKNINDFYTLVIFVFFAIITKITYVYLIFLIITSGYFFKFKIFKEKKFIIFLIIVSCLWFLRNLLISGCLIFPISFTCVELPWSNNIDSIEYFFNEAKSWARATRDRTEAGNFAHTLQSFDWFIPWFKDYFINTSILKILSLSFLLLFLKCIYILIFQNNKKKFSLFNHKLILLMIFFLIGTFVWLQSPEVRYGHGLIISIIVFNVICIIKLSNFKRFLKVNFLKISCYFIFILLCLKNYDVIKNFNNVFVQSFDHSEIILVKETNGFKLYSPNPSTLTNSEYHKFCGDFKGICGYLNHPNGISEINIKINKYGHFYFSQ